MIVESSMRKEISIILVATWRDARAAGSSYSVVNARLATENSSTGKT